MSRYRFSAACTEAWPVQLLCRVLAVSPAGYYQWRQRPPAAPAPWQAAAQAAFTRHARRYGTRRLRAELHAEGHAVGRYALRTWLHRHHLQALSTRPHRPRTTVADPAATVTENRLLGQPAPTAPNQVWVGDITYLPLVGGRWLPGHLARCLLPAGGGRVPGRPDADRIGAPRPGKGLDTAPTGPGPDGPRRPGSYPVGQPVHQRRLPRPRRASRRPAQLQPAGQPLRQCLLGTTQAEAGARLKPNCCPTAPPLTPSKKPSWKWPITSTPTLTWTAATPPWVVPGRATARPTNLNAT